MNRFVMDEKGNLIRNTDFYGMKKTHLNAVGEITEMISKNKEEEERNKNVLRLLMNSLYGKFANEGGK